MSAETPVWCDGKFANEKCSDQIELHRTVEDM